MVVYDQLLSLATFHPQRKYLHYVLNRMIG